MEWIGKGEAGKPPLTADEVKVCDLCGTLNYRGNVECFTCGWRGQFSRDAALISFAWQRLTDSFEGVRMEHLTARPHTVLGELGTPHRMAGWQRLRFCVCRCWQTLFRARVRRPLQGQASAAQPNDVGV